MIGWAWLLAAISGRVTREEEITQAKQVQEAA